jgi:hypothetical protein
MSKIRRLMRRAKSMDEFRALIRQSDTQLTEDMWIFYKEEADWHLKKRLGLPIEETWHVFWVETHREPINEWEKLSHHGQILIRDNLEEIRLIAPES